MPKTHPETDRGFNPPNPALRHAEMAVSMFSIAVVIVFATIGAFAVAQFALDLLLAGKG